MMQAILRAVAIAIAVLALLDPSVVREVTRAQRITIVLMDPADAAHAERLSTLLAADYDLQVHIADTTVGAAACPATGGCVFVSRGQAPHRATAGAMVIGALRVSGDDTVVRTAAAPRRVHREASSQVHVQLSRPVARVEVFDGDVRVGSLDTGEARAVDIPWVPLGAGVRALRVVADRDAVDLGVIVDAAPVPIFMLETEPTWLGTFVRRALDDDPRLTVLGRTRVAPPVAITRGDAPPLSQEALAQAGAVIVASPRGLSAADVQLLDAFVARRGGSLILLPDSRPSGAVLELMPRVTHERREPQPQDAGVLRVREWLTFEAGVGATALVRVGDEPIVVSQALGRGRVITSGALDAWRFRGATSGFNAFWADLAWDAVAAAGDPLRVELDRVLIEPGEQVRVTAEVQRIAAPPLELDASATLRCGDDVQVVRVWPGGRPGTFEGTIRPTTLGDCELTVSVDDATATTPLLVQAEVRRRRPTEALTSLVHAHGGIVVEPGREQELADRVQAQLPHQREARATWPMRSPAWVLLLTGCLAGEWWLRRRSGLS